MRRRDPERGVVAVLAVFFVLVLGAVLALSFNLGLLMKSRGELQGASDSAALAAAESLDGTVASLRAGRRAAREFAATHDVTGQAVRIDEEDDVRYGFWHFDRERCTYSNGTCPEGFEESPDPEGRPFALTAVQVNNGRDTDPNHNSPLPVVFGAFVQRTRPLIMTSGAVAVTRRARVDCALPIGLFECAEGFLTGAELVCDSSGALPAPLVVTDDDPAQLPRVNLLGESRPSAGRVSQQILHNQEHCQDQDFQTGSVRFEAGGNLRTVVDAVLGFDGEDQEGPCLVGQKRTVPVVECRERRGRRTVVGFVDVFVESVTCRDGTRAACPAGRVNPCAGHQGGGRSRRSVALRVTCDDPLGASGGPGYKLRLVK
jgi:hypothetical protein